MEQPGKGCPRVAFITDRYGNTVAYGNSGDHWHPSFPIGEDTDYRTHVRRIRDMEIRPDDVLICSYPKTVWLGLHWTTEIVRMLMKKTSDITANFPSDDNTPEFLDRQPMSLIDRNPSPRLLYTHVPFRYLPKQAFEKKITIIHLDRNPKDVLVSYYCHFRSFKETIAYKGTFEQFFRFYFDCGSKHWRETISLNPVQGVMDLNEYLGTGCSPELCAAIARACDFEVLKPRKEAAMSESMLKTFVDKKPIFYRKGQVGDWKNWFTVAMDEEFEEQYRKRLSGYKHKYRFTLE